MSGVTHRVIIHFKKKTNYIQTDHDNRQTNRVTYRKARFDAGHARLTKKEGRKEDRDMARQRACVSTNVKQKQDLERNINI